MYKNINRFLCKYFPAKDDNGTKQNYVTVGSFINGVIENGIIIGIVAAIVTAVLYALGEIVYVLLNAATLDQTQIGGTFFMPVISGVSYGIMGAIVLVGLIWLIIKIKNIKIAECKLAGRPKEYRYQED